MKKVVDKFENIDTYSLFFKEWLVTNGLGGYAAGSISCTPMRKYHGLLMAALPTPYGRTIVLNYVADSLVLQDNKEVKLSLIRTLSNKDPVLEFPLVEFRLEDGLPVWRYVLDGDIVLEKKILLIHRQNTLHMTYEILSAKDPLQIKWRPYFHFRTSEQSVNCPIDNEAYDIHTFDNQYEISCPLFPILRLYNERHPPFTLDIHKIEDVFYEIEQKRGYESVGRLSSPGYFLLPLHSGEKVTFIASLETWKTIHVLNPEEAYVTERQRRRSIVKKAGHLAHSKLGSKLVLAADQFIMTPTSRENDMIRLQALGDEVRSIIAGFPWFLDWGRDTMISLEGLTLTTGRYQVAYAILNTFAFYIKDGLIPNMFPEDRNEAYYNTADATLWFFHAIDRYITITNDDSLLDHLLPKLVHIIDYHIKGTHYGIKVDSDGLLMQGIPGAALTWMDAKMDAWVVTPRRGKAVEINALWYNALRILEEWTGKILPVTQQCYESFNNRFWSNEKGYLLDVVDGENGDNYDIRPNQLFAISLKYPVLKQEHWKSVLETVTKELLTPVGLRTLSPLHTDFKAYYDGNLQARDGAYHQGTVWPWLLGPFIDVWLKVYPNDFEGAERLLKGLEDHLYTICMGSIGEIFDAQDPYHARGCFAQAWSVAEFLRCLAKVTKKDTR